MIFHNLCRIPVHLLYTVYGTPLGPGAEADLAARTTSLISFQVGMLILNGNSGGFWGIRRSFLSSSWSFNGSLMELRRKVFISSSDAFNLPLRLSPNNVLAKPYGLERKFARFLALSFRLLLCHSALRTVFNFSLNMILNSLRGWRSSAYPFLYCFLLDLNSFLNSLILITVRLAL